MADIAALPPNGFNVVSTFSGCGGSCLGYRMAGFRVVWASEFVPAAQETYRANHPETLLDTRDIRQVRAADIISATGIPAGCIDLLDGSPPCASFSTAGKREKAWGKVKQYSDTEQRTDDLFFEYARLLKELQPRTFVAENVSGLIKGKAKGYFLQILQALKDCGYRVSARLLDAQWLGVPQARERLIFVGVRNDLRLEPVHPAPLAYRYSVADALPWIRSVEVIGPQFTPAMRPADQPAPTIAAQGNFSFKQSPFTLVEAEPECNWTAVSDAERVITPDDPAPTITTHGRGQTAICIRGSGVEKRQFTIRELKRICGFPDDFVLTGTYGQQWERLGRAVPPVMMAAVAATVRDNILCRIK